MSLLSRWSGTLLILALMPRPGLANEALSRPLTILSLPAQHPSPTDEGLSRSGTLMFLPARAAPSSPEAISRPVTHLSLPARRPPANDEVVARSFSIETPGIPLSAPGQDEIAGSLSIGHAAPNPFRTVTRIRYSLVDPTLVRVKIFDLAGRLVRTLSDRQESAGGHVVAWEGISADNRRVAAGVYLCQLEVGSLRHTRRIVILE